MKPASEVIEVNLEEWKALLERARPGAPGRRGLSEAASGAASLPSS